MGTGHRPVPAATLRCQEGSNHTLHLNTATQNLQGTQQVCGWVLAWSGAASPWEEAPKTALLQDRPLVATDAGVGGRDLLLNVNQDAQHVLVHLQTLQQCCLAVERAKETGQEA